MADAEAIAAVLTPSFRTLTFLPMLHTAEEDRGFVRDVVLPQCTVWVAEGSTGIVAFLARHEQEIRMLYTHPDAIGNGAGHDNRFSFNWVHAAVCAATRAMYVCKFVSMYVM